MEIRLQQVTFRGATSWLIHQTSNDKDVYWSTSSGSLMRFDSLETAKAEVAASGKQLLCEPLPAVDLSRVGRFADWSRGPVCSDTLYNAWNFFGDLAATYKQRFSGHQEAAIEVQEELFWSSSLTGQATEPTLDESQADMLIRVLREGLGRLQNLWTERHLTCVSA